MCLKLSFYKKLSYYEKSPQSFLKVRGRLTTRSLFYSWVSENLFTILSCLFTICLQTCIFPPPQLAPIRKPAHLEDKSCAHIRSSSNSSSGDCKDVTCNGILSQGAPVKVAKPSMALPETKAS